MSAGNRMAWVVSCRWWLVPLLALGLAGCKIRILVPDGGFVASNSGSISCPARGDCEIEVSDLSFNETFRAYPDSGWEFSHWAPVTRGLCGGDSAACRLSTRDFDDKPAVQALLASSEVFYLVPVFERTDPPGC